MLAAVVGAALIAAGLLALRRERLETLHEVATLHAQIDATRQQTWNLQSRIAAGTQPGQLRAALERAGMAMEPVTEPELPPVRPGSDGVDPRVAAAER